MKVRIAQSAKEDLRRSSRFYDDQTAGQGKKFASFHQTAGKLRFSGGMHEKVVGLHRCLMPPYPYAIFYIKQDLQVIVLAIVDCRGHPNAIDRHLRSVKTDFESQQQ